MNNELKDDLIKSDLEARYDEHVKKLLSNKKTLAWILKYSASEYKDCTINEIVGFIEGTPEISSVGVDPGFTSQSIKGSPNEDIIINEGMITYDLRFEALAPGTDDEYIQLIVNIEAQNKFNPGYPLLKRAVYYCSRMISAQKGLEFVNSEYNKIKKVYSIWICTNPPQTHRNTITRYKISEENVIGNVKEPIEHYDLMNIVILCLGTDNDIEDNALGVLNTLLSDTMSSSERIEILDKKFDFDMSPDDEKEVSEMCNVSRGVYDKGMDKGMAIGMDKGIAIGMDRGVDKGMAIGIDKSTLNSISKMMAAFHVTADQAMDILEVPTEKRDYYKSRISE
ncbi:MAG: hypothetical protein ACI4DY_15310, partial [Monoglobaceae bacterium]